MTRAAPIPVWLALFVSEVCAQEPVGIVVAADGAQLLRPNSELALTARKGDLLFPGDALSTGAGSASIWYCPESQAYTIAPGSILAIDAGQVRLKSGRIVERSPRDICILPPVDRKRLAEVRFYGARLRRSVSPPAKPSGTPDSRLQALGASERSRLLAELAPVDRALGRDPGDTAARMARAAILQKYRLHTDAIEEYRKIAEAWGQVDWPRQLVHEEEDLVRKSGPVPVREDRPGKTYALLVGISQYPRLKADEQLLFAHRDAAVFADHLKSGRGGALPGDQIQLLTNERATTAAIRTAIATFLRARAGKQDTVVLFVAAHGVVESRGAYVVTYDSDPEDLQTTALPMADIQHLLEEEFPNVGRVLLYVDVCRAGMIGTIRRNSIGKVLEVYLAGEGVESFGLLGSRPGEVSIEHERFGGGHGAFSYFLLRGLNGDADENHDGEITAGELVEYVRTKVREATRKQQTPRETGTMSSSAVLVKELNQPGIALADWRPLDVVVAGKRNIPPPRPATVVLPVDAARPQVTGEFASFDEALQAGRIVSDEPGSAFGPLRSLAAALQDRRDDYLQLENRLLIALEDKGQDVLLRYLRGDQVPQQRSDFAAGERYFRSALELEPGAWALESRVLFCRGRVKIFDKRYTEALEVLERAARLDPGGAYILNALGIAYLETGDFVRAAAAFRDAVRRAPQWSYPQHNLALALTERGDYSAAIAAYQQAMRLAPQSAYLPYNLGLLYQRLNRRKDAEGALRKSAASAPESAASYNALGFLKAASGKRREAESLYRQSLEKDPIYAPARHNLALLLAEDAERVDEALALWRTNLKGAPDFLPSRLSLAETLDRLGDGQGAAREYEAMIHDRPDLVSARLALAALLEKQGRTDQAADQLRESLLRRPRNPIILERLGDLERSRGRNAEARRNYEQALESATDSRMRKRIRGKM